MNNPHIGYTYVVATKNNIEMSWLRHEGVGARGETSVFV